MKQIKEVRIEVTNRCNTNCVMCPRDEMVTPLGTMSNELFFQIIDECVEMKIPTIVLCGFGELFLDKSIKDKLSYLKKALPEQHVTMTSNGSMIKEDMADFLAECPWISSVRVSVSGFDPETYKAIMKFKRDKIYDNLTYFHAKLKEKKSPTQFRVNGIYLDDLFKDGELDQYISYWQENADVVEVWKPHNWTGIYDYRKDSVNLDDVQSCGRPDNGPVEIMWNGNYKICCFDSDGVELIGSYQRHSLKDFWEMPGLIEVQEIHRQKEFQKLKTCGKCDQIYKKKEEDIVVFSNAGIDKADRIQRTGDFTLLER